MIDLTLDIYETSIPRSYRKIKKEVKFEYTNLNVHLVLKTASPVTKIGRQKEEWKIPFTCDDEVF